MPANINETKKQLGLQFPLVNKRELYKLIRLRTNYKLYEIEDILLAMANISNELLASGRSVEIPYLLNIYPKINNPKTWNDPKTGTLIKSKGSRSIKVRISDSTRKALNPKD